MEEDRIGIPAHLLNRDKGLRIPIRHWGEGLLVFDKPQSIASKADPWFLKDPDLENAFNVQIPDGKPELIHHGIHFIRVFNPLEPEATGVVLACCNEDMREQWKNAYGSRQFIFHTLIITRKSLAPPVINCDLPLVRHFKNQQMMVSHNLGKKTFTRFSLIAQGRNADAWLASAQYPRLHQLRIHSRERGIPLLRDPIYDPTYPENLREADRLKLDWMHNYAVQTNYELNTLSPSVMMPPPKYWKRNLRKVGLEIDEITSKSDEIIENITLPIE
jgi:23S rRNA-/tRNA-specific pseudouridylate synthase